MDIRPIIAVLLLGCATAASAEETVVKLSPEQREQALEAAAVNGGAEPPINGLPGVGGGRQIHGEVGMAIGTGGLRSVYGAIGAPIGDNASASFYYENSRYRGRYGRFAPYY